MNSELPWKIIDKYFKDNPNALVKHHLDSYNDFFNKLTEYQQWKKMIKYFLFRDLESSIGSVKAIVYFKSDY